MFQLCWCYSSRESGALKLRVKLERVAVPAGGAATFEGDRSLGSVRGPEPCGFQHMENFFGIHRSSHVSHYTPGT